MQTALATFMSVHVVSGRSRGGDLAPVAYTVCVNAVACRGLVMPGATAWLYAPFPNSNIEPWRIVRATIDLESKIKTAEENLFLLPKENNCFCLYD